MKAVGQRFRQRIEIPAVAGQAMHANNGVRGRIAEFGESQAIEPRSQKIGNRSLNAPSDHLPVLNGAHDYRTAGPGQSIVPAPRRCPLASADQFA